MLNLIATPVATKETLNDSHSQTSSSWLHRLGGRGLGWNGPGCGTIFKSGHPISSGLQLCSKPIPRFPVLWAPFPESVANFGTRALGVRWVVPGPQLPRYGAHGPHGVLPHLPQLPPLPAPAPQSSNQNPPARHVMRRHTLSAPSASRPSTTHSSPQAGSPCHLDYTARQGRKLGVLGQKPRERRSKGRACICRAIKIFVVHLTCESDGYCAPRQERARRLPVAEWPPRGHSSALIDRAPRAQRFHSLLCSTVPQEIHRNPSQPQEGWFDKRTDRFRRSGRLVLQIAGRRCCRHILPCAARYGGTVT